MPIYEYECTGCSFRFELKQSFSEDTTVSCPRCGGKVQRIFSPVSIIFKGTGFYVTDSRNSNSHILNESSTDKAKARSSDVAKDSHTDTAKDSHTDTAKDSSNNGAKAGSTEKDS